MNNLFIIEEFNNYGYNSKMLDLISLLCILCAVLVIISKNPIISILFLIGLFLNISAYLIIVGLGFIGLSYLLVYVGAVSILFIFILMLINVRISELSTGNINSVPLAILVGIVLSYPTYILGPNIYIKEYVISNNILFINDIFTFFLDMFYIFWDTCSNIFNLLYILHSIINIKNSLAMVTANMWDTLLNQTSDISSIGNIIYTHYFIWLIITSIILLLAMVGAIVITIKQKKVIYV